MAWYATMKDDEVRKVLLGVYAERNTKPCSPRKIKVL